MSDNLHNAGESGGWRTIESAPSCGIRVIGWCAEWKECFVVKYSPNRPFPHWTTDNGSVTDHPPTHWQHLPWNPNESKFHEAKGDIESCAALASILEERKRQIKKWGEQNHTLGNWGLILMEEVGEWSEAALHTEFGGPKADGLRNEAVQVGAVALQIVQWLDKQNVEVSGGCRR